MTNFDEPTERVATTPLLALTPTSTSTVRPRPGLDTTKTTALSIEPSHAAAETLAAILAVPLNAEAAAEMSAANHALLDFKPEGLMSTLARNLVVLQALSMRLIKDAMEAAKNPIAQAALLRTALQAQRETREIIALMRDLQREAKQPTPIDV